MASVARRAIAVALAATFLGASGALAGSGGTTGNGVKVIPFTAVYDVFSCVGVRIEKTRPKVLTQDSEVCTYTDVTAFDPPGRYSIPPNHWASDYEWFVLGPGGPNCAPQYPEVCLRWAVSGTIVVINTRGGTGILYANVSY
jgi:hypothetical protein